MDDAPNVIVRLNYYPAKSNSAKYAKRREFYSSNMTDDYMRYIDKGIVDKNIPITDAMHPDFMDYVGDNEKSSGVFDKDGLLNKEQKADLRNRLRATGSVIWDMVISFKAGYGQKNIKDCRDAQGLLNAQLNRFFKQAGLHPDNITWYAGLHINTENSHIHVSFFEREPRFLRQKDRTRYYHNGKLRQAGIDGFKIGVEQYFCDTTVQLKAARQAVLTAAKHALAYSMDKNGLNKYVAAKIAEIIKELPDKGYISYMGDKLGNVRLLADKITAFILNCDEGLNRSYGEFVNRLLVRDENTKAYCKRNKIKNVGDYLVTDKTVKDLYRRLGNLVINTAVHIKSNYYDTAQVRTTMQGVVNKRAARKTFLKKTFELSAWTVGRYTDEVAQAFAEYLKQLEQAKMPEPPQNEKEEMCL